MAMLVVDLVYKFINTNRVIILNENHDIHTRKIKHVTRPRPWSYRLHKKMTPATRKRVRNPKLLWNNTGIPLERNGCAKLSWILITWLRLAHTCHPKHDHDRSFAWSIYRLQWFGLPFWTKLQTQVRKPSGAQEVTNISSSIWSGGVQTPQGLVSSLVAPLGLVSKTNRYQNSGTNKEI